MPIVFQVKYPAIDGICTFSVPIHRVITLLIICISLALCILPRLPGTRLLLLDIAIIIHVQNQHMRPAFLFAFGLLTLCACNTPTGKVSNTAADSTTNKGNLTGTYKLVYSTIQVKGDSAKPLPMENQEMVKIFNGSHFAFFRHDLSQGKGPNAIYDSGGGTYTLSGDAYTEHLVYCIGREWENHDFNFTLTRHADSLIQKGVEKLDSLKIEREIVEVYVKVP